MLAGLDDKKSKGEYRIDAHEVRRAGDQLAG